MVLIPQAREENTAPIIWHHPQAHGFAMQLKLLRSAAQVTASSSKMLCLLPVPEKANSAL